jgi:uncharacterized protein (TIGR03382 family)
MHAQMRMICAASAAVVFASSAYAVVNPFTEDFSSNVANWRQSDGVAPMVWSAAGGPDGGSYASATYNFVTTGPGSTPAIIRGQDAYDSSGDAFVGDWLAAGVQTFSFDIRHDAGVPMVFFARVATSANFPGAGAIEFTPVPSGVWTTISFAIDPADWTLEGPITFESVFGFVGNIQIGADPGSLANVDQVVTFDVDKISIVPTPGTLAFAGALGLVGFRRRR